MQIICSCRTSRNSASSKSTFRYFHFAYRCVSLTQRTLQLSQKVAKIEQVSIENFALDFTVSGYDIELRVRTHLPLRRWMEADLLIAWRAWYLSNIRKCQRICSWSPGCDPWKRRFASGEGFQGKILQGLSNHWSACIFCGRTSYTFWQFWRKLEHGEWVNCPRLRLDILYINGYDSFVRSL